MSRTVTKSARQEDLKRAEKLMKAFAELQKDKQAITEKLNEKLAPVVESLKEAEAELIQIGQRNRKAFDENKNLVFEDGYLHIADKTTVVYGKGFSWKRFIAKFPDYVDLKPKIAALKKVFTDGDARKPFVALDIDLKQEETMEVKVNKL